MGFDYQDASIPATGPFCVKFKPTVRPESVFTLSRVPI